MEEQYITLRLNATETVALMKAIQRQLPVVETDEEKEALQAIVLQAGPQITLAKEQATEYTRRLFHQRYSNDA